MVSEDNNPAESTETPQPKQSPKPRWFALLLLMAITGGMCICLGEFAVRLFAPQPPSWLDVYKHHPTLDTYALLPSIEREVETGENKWNVIIDDRGFRVTAIEDDVANAPLCLGDSFTFGQGVSHADTFVGKLQSQGDPSLAFVNTGVPGYGPIQYRQVLEYLLSQGRNPSRVLAAVYMGNDFHDCVWKAEGKTPKKIVDGILGNRGDFKSTVKRSSHLYRLVSKVYHRLAPANPQNYDFREAMYNEDNWSEGVLKNGFDRFHKEFGLLAAVCRDRGIELDVVLIPTEDALSGKDDSNAKVALPIEKAKGICAAHGISVFDLTPHLEAKPVSDLFFAHDGHFTPLGHTLTADAISAWYAQKPAP